MIGLRLKMNTNLALSLLDIWIKLAGMECNKLKEKTKRLTCVHHEHAVTLDLFIFSRFIQCLH